MRNDVESALRNTKQIEIPDSTTLRVDNVLRSLDERKDITNMKPKYLKPGAIAAVIVVSLLAFSTVALAYTGVLSDVFSAITGGRNIEGEFGTDTRKAIVENEHVAGIEPQTSVADDGSLLELNAYFADSREIWFDFTLSNADIPDDWTPEHQILPGLFYLEMIQSDGTVHKWESIHEEGFSRTTFPGGHSFHKWDDLTDDSNEHVATDNSHRFVTNNTVSLSDDGSLDITVIVSFSHPYPTIGDKINLQVGNFFFNVVDWDSFVEGADNTAAVNRTWLDGVWEFEIDVDNRFTDVSELIYNVVDIDEAAQLGIMIHSITVTPTAGRVEVSIDLSKNNLLNPNYAVIHNPINMIGDDGLNVLLNPTPQQILDYSLMRLVVYAEANGKKYSIDGATEEMNGDILEGWFEFGSMYFDAPRDLTLVFETEVFGGEYTEEPIRIPLRLAG